MNDQFPSINEKEGNEKTDNRYSSLVLGYWASQRRREGTEKDAAHGVFGLTLQ
jgi:hypothetical protein